MAIVEGLFGGFMPSYDEALSGLMKQRQASNAAKTQGLGPYAGITQVGLEQAQQMGDYAGKALGYEQPELAKAKQRDQAWNEAIASVKNQSDPEEVYTALAKTFQKYGLTKEALQAATKASEARAEKTKEKRAERSLQIQEESAKRRSYSQVTGYTTADGKPLAFDPTTGDYFSEGQKYTGKLKPKPSGPYGQLPEDAVPTGETEQQRAARLLRERQQKAKEGAAAKGKDPYYDPMPGDDGKTLAEKARRRKERDQGVNPGSGGIGEQIIAP